MCITFHWVCPGCEQDTGEQEKWPCSRHASCPGEHDETMTMPLDIFVDFQCEEYYPDENRKCKLPGLSATGSDENVARDESTKKKILDLIARHVRHDVTPGQEKAGDFYDPADPYGVYHGADDGNDSGAGDAMDVDDSSSSKTETDAKNKTPRKAKPRARSKGKAKVPGGRLRSKGVVDMQAVPQNLLGKINALDSEIKTAKQRDAKANKWLVAEDRLLYLLKEKLAEAVDNPMPIEQIRDLYFQHRIPQPAEWQPRDDEKYKKQGKNNIEQRVTMLRRTPGKWPYPDDATD